MTRNLKVIDLSHYQTVTDINAIKNAGVIGVIHKASQGTRYIDPYYASRRREFEAAGLAWASYHFLMPDHAEEQMAHYLSAARAALSAMSLTMSA